MRKVMIALAAVLLLAAPVSAQEETTPDDYIGGIVPSLEVLAAAAKDAAEGADPMPAYTEAADMLAEHLLTVTPAECYRESVLAAWLLYSDLIHIVALESEDGVAGVELLFGFMEEDMAAIMADYAC